MLMDGLGLPQVFYFISSAGEGFLLDMEYIRGAGTQNMITCLFVVSRDAALRWPTNAVR